MTITNSVQDAPVLQKTATAIVKTISYTRLLPLIQLRHDTQPD